MTGGGLYLSWPVLVVILMACVSLVAVCIRLARKVGKLEAERRSLQERLWRDSLTRLASRDKAEDELARAMDKGVTMRVLFIDLNYFKEVNDRYGHPTGDAVLIAIAERLRRAFAGCVVARFQGDEFVVLLPSGWPGDVAAALAVIDRPIGLGDYTITVGKAYGEVRSDHFPSVGDLMREVDALMYEDKRKRDQDVSQGGDEHGGNRDTARFERSGVAGRAGCVRQRGDHPE
jgi:diguanylate cyclase (GGDEF)-like protein